MASVACTMKGPEFRMSCVKQGRHSSLVHTLLKSILWRPYAQLVEVKKMCTLDQLEKDYGVMHSNAWNNWLEHCNVVDHAHAKRIFLRLYMWADLLV